MGSDREHELAVYAFDLLRLDGEDLGSLPLIEHRRRLERLLSRAKVPCLHLWRHSTMGDCRDWRKVKTLAWRAANKERWPLFEWPG
jgi:ATP-dependent DNA ligase